MSTSLTKVNNHIPSCCIKASKHFIQETMYHLHKIPKDISKIINLLLFTNYFLQHCNQSISILPCFCNHKYTHKQYKNNTHKIPKILTANIKYCIGVEFTLLKSINIHAISINANLMSHICKFKLISFNIKNKVYDNSVVFNKCEDNVNKICMKPYWNNEESTLFVFNDNNEKIHYKYDIGKDNKFVELKNDKVYRLGFIIHDGMYFKNWLDCRKYKNKKNKLNIKLKKQFKKIKWVKMTMNLKEIESQLEWFPFIRLVKYCNTYQFK